MSYTLKSIRYHNEPRKILLQNENGPCPLLAAANALLLRGVISLPPSCIQVNAASIDDVVNTLAECALRVSGSDLDKDGTIPVAPNDEVRKEGREFQVDELLSIFPSLQYGMDVNPKLTAGPAGVEYTKNLTAFDLVGVELVHGWLVDPQDLPTAQAIGSRTYNELVEVVVKGEEANKEIQRLEGILNDLEAEAQDLEQAFAQTMDTETGATGSDQGKETETPPAQSLDLETDALVPDEGEDQTETPSDQSLEVQTDAPAPEQGKDPSEGETQTVSEQKHDEDWVDVSPSTNETKTENDQSNIEDTGITTTQNNTNSQYESLLAKSNQIITTKTLLDAQRQIQNASSVITTFLTSTSNQLTIHGLSELHSYVKENSICVFFRNNHFATLTKESGVLYLLVTDLGYAGVNEVVWEKLDDVTGDTEYTDDLFETSKPRDQSEMDYQLAMQLSQNGVQGEGGGGAGVASVEEERDVASAIEASILESANGGSNVASIQDKEMDQVTHKIRDHDRASELLAMRLQAEEAEASVMNSNHIPPTTRSREQNKQNKGCAIS